MNNIDTSHDSLDERTSAINDEIAFNRQLFDRIARKMEGDRTVMVGERLRNRVNYRDPDENSMYGYFNGKHIIGRESPIIGGVYLGGSAREAIIVDDQHDANVLNDLYADLVKNIIGLPRNLILKSVYDLVKDTMTYSEAGVDKITIGKWFDQEVHLSQFIANKVGVCRHQGLLAAYLMERLVKENYIDGTASMERNATLNSAHAWASFTTVHNKVYILDAAQDYFGPLKKNHAGWAYHALKRAPQNNAQKKSQQIPKLITNHEQLRRITKIRPGKTVSIAKLKTQIKIGMAGPNTVDLYWHKGHLAISYASKGQKRVSKYVREIIEGNTISIGRNPDNQIVFRDSAVSAQHCKLKFQKNLITISDLNTTNGTWIRIVPDKEPDLNDMIDNLVKRILKLLS